MKQITTVHKRVGEDAIDSRPDVWTPTRRALAAAAERPRPRRPLWSSCAREHLNRAGRTQLALALAASVGLLLPLADLRAHGDLHQQIESVAQKIQQHPTAALFLKRGELHRAHEDYNAALADFDRAADLDPNMDVVLLCRGQTLFAADKLPPAKAALNQFLGKRPDYAEGHLTRARILAGLKELAASAADYDHAIKLYSEPRPEHFVERARVLQDLGEVERALAGLDDGMKQLGTIPTLQLVAIEIELKRQRFDAALQRVDSLITQAERKETWLARRGEILAQAGRPAEAMRAYAEALAAIGLLAPRARNTQATQQLEAQLRKATNQIARN